MPEDSRKVQVLIVAAEASGDRHAAQLVGAVRRQCPDLAFAGFGGKEMSDAGCRIYDDLTGMASMVLGFLGGLRRFFKLVKRFDRLLKEERPDAVVLVDSPGLNFLLARLARWRGIPVVYYICPQIWAWAPWRRSKVLRWCDLLMVILPFEETLYGGGGVPVRFVGHPLADEMAALRPSLGAELRSRLSIPPSDRVIGVFPGSRRREIETLMPYFTRLIRQMDLDPSRHRVAVSCCRSEFLPSIETACRELDLPLEIVQEDARVLMMACDFALVASGTASLELAYLEKPMAVFYQTNRIARGLFRFFSVTPWIALPNILGCGLESGSTEAGRGEGPVVLERLFVKDPNGELASRVKTLLEEGSEREAALRRLRWLREHALRPGGVACAASTLISFLRDRGVENLTTQTEDAENARIVADS